jgi:hypothetical protein
MSTFEITESFRVTIVQVMAGFISQIIWKDFTLKNLSRLFPCDDTMAVIIDDREDVWLNPQKQVPPNLIKIEPCIISLYVLALPNVDHYFETTHEINQLTQDKQVDTLPRSSNNNISRGVRDDIDEYLSIMENILVQVHTIFYESSDNNRDTKVGTVTYDQVTSK